MGKLQADLMDRVKSFKKKASRLYQIDRLIVFGSSVRGSRKRDSDVDMIVVSKGFEGMGFLKRPVELRLLWRRGVPLDLICLTPEEFKELKRKVSLVSIAIKEGVEA